ncbi:VanZ family protein [Kitasatospora sp. NPDC088134]|uniref:VanZ family protein n=1 Tax=Kitasatospora sp. NPDC088134 TaxID=3364071 RepID=UPI0037FD1888
MISAVLNGSPGLVPTFLALALLLGPAALLLARRRELPRWSLLLLTLALAGELTATLFPSGQGGGGPHAICALGTDLDFTLAREEGRLNVLMYVPLGLFAVLALGRPVLVTAALLGLTAATETAQALLPGIGRACDASDLQANSLGALLGVALGCLGRLLLRRRLRPRRRELIAAPVLLAALAVPVVPLQLFVIDPAPVSGTADATAEQRELAAKDAELLFGPGTRVLRTQYSQDGYGHNRLAVTLERSSFELDWPTGRLVGLNSPLPGPAAPGSLQQARTAADRFADRWLPGAPAPVLAEGVGQDGSHRFSWTVGGAVSIADITADGRVVQFQQYRSQQYQPR